MQDTTVVLLLPGWLDSDALHWHSHWEARHGCTRVQQADWLWPRRGDWMAQLEEAVLQARAPVVLAAHSLGCQLVAAWAAHSQNTSRVRAALLVAPADTERPDMPPQLHGWRVIVRQRLPFRAQVLYSEDDPYCDPARAQGMAADWGAAATSVGAAGHINGQSGLGDWPWGLAQLRALCE
jgi:predicted alpha/beta hydrolase family esterase